MQKLGFRWDNLRVVLGWTFACALMTGSLWKTTLCQIDQDQTAIRLQLFNRAAALSSAHAERLTRRVEQIDQITRHIQYDWRKTGGHIDLADQAKEGLFPLSAYLYVNVVDRNGTLVSSTSSEVGKADIADRDDFQAHQNGAASGLLISDAAYSPDLNKAVISLSRRLESPEGQFDGIVVVAVEPAYFASLPESATPRKEDFFSVWRTDGSLLGMKASAPDSAVRSLQVPKMFSSQKGIESYPAESLSDKERNEERNEERNKERDQDRRIVAWQQLDGFPLLSVVGVSESRYFAAHEEDSALYRKLAIAGTVLLVLVAVGGIALNTRLALRRRQTDKIKSTYRFANDGAREGFYMVRGLYDDDDHVIDFLVEDCNECGARYYGMVRQQLIGKKFSDLLRGAFFTEAVQTFEKAMESGFIEDEFRVPPDSPLKLAWVHRRFVRSGDGLAVTLRDISDKKQHEEALSRLANADALTELPNRHWLMSYLPTAVSCAREKQSKLAVLFVDLDDFKNINDTQGHAAGDELLRAVASRLRAVVRPHDNVVRLGGDEFTIILEDVNGRGDVVPVASRIIASLSEPFVLADAGSHIVHASIGISMFPHDGENGDTLLKYADVAMYAAKESGKGHYEFYRPQLTQSLLIRLERERALRKAIDRDEFVVFYQPRVDTLTGELRALEVLVRWMHQERGIVSPQEFISIAEETGMIVQLGQVVIQKACAQLAHWREQNLDVVPVSLNVSPRQFNEGSLSQFLSECMRDYDIAPELIEIEITESCMMGEGSSVDNELAAIEALGIKLLVDDFGTGYSSMSHLQRLDFDILKVDQAFTTRLCTGEEGEAFFMAIVSMAHVLGMSVVAEGVETVEQLRTLQQMSCNEVQGFFISPPVPANEVVALLSKRFLFHSDRRLPLPDPVV